MDRETHTYADFNKVRPIDFVGKYFKSRGPLNTDPLPAAPTDHPAGRRLPARPGVRGQSGRLDRRRRHRCGRNAGVPQRHPRPRRRGGPRSRRHQADVLRLTDRGGHEAEAQAELDRLTSVDSYIEKQLVGISSNTEIDFKQFDWDEPLPADLTTNGERGSLEHFMRGDGTPGPKTLRQLAIDWADHRHRVRRHPGIGRPRRWARRWRRSAVTAS